MMLKNAITVTSRYIKMGTTAQLFMCTTVCLSVSDSQGSTVQHLTWTWVQGYSNLLFV